MECVQPRRMHATGVNESLNISDVYRAPDTGFAARRESNPVGGFVDWLANAVDPAEAKCFID